MRKTDKFYALIRLYGPVTYTPYGTVTYTPYGTVTYAL